MNKLRAFTIIEIVIVLLLSTIVTGIAYSSYTIIAKQYSRFAGETSATNHIMHLDRALAADFLRSNIIKLTSEGFECIQADTSISYHFADSLIIRSWNDLVVDTFRFKVDSAILSFEGKEQHFPGGLIDNAKICLEKDGKRVILVKRKWYSAEALLNSGYGRN